MRLNPEKIKTPSNLQHKYFLNENSAENIDFRNFP